MSNIRLHHVGMLMPSEEAAAQFMKLIGLEEDHRGYVPEYKALCIFAKGSGASQVELDGKPVLHHLAFAVDDLAAAQASYAGKGMPLLDEKPVQGAGDFIVNFLRPRHTGGILVEFVQETG
jgi:catechol 2,3-dioxygenase-like lactoylglutathione lyase family enzyme